MTAAAADSGGAGQQSADFGRWVVGLAAVLVAAAVVSAVTVTMATIGRLSALETSVEYMRSDVVRMTARIEDGSRIGYNADAAARDRAALMDLINGNSASVSQLRTEVIALRERVARLERGSQP